MKIIKIIIALFISTFLGATDSIEPYKIINNNNVFTLLSKDKGQIVKGKWSVIYSMSRYNTDDGKKYTPTSQEIDEKTQAFTLHVDQNTTLKYAHVIFKPQVSWKTSTVVRIKRNLKVSGVVVGYMPGSICDNGLGKPIDGIVELLYEGIYDDRLSMLEKKDIRWKIDGIHVAKYDGKEYFLYKLDKKHTFKAYFEGKEDEAEEISAR